MARAQGRPADAILSLQGVLARIPVHAAGLQLLGEVLRESGRAAEAVTVLSRLVASHPGSHEAHSDLASALREIGRVPEAESHARQALAINPLNPQAHNLLGTILADAHHFEEAEFHYRQVLLFHEPLAPICSNLANALVKLGRLDEAAEAFEMAAHLDEANIENWLSWARMEEGRRNLAKAWELLERAEHLKTRHPLVHVVRSSLHRRARQFDQALETLERAAMQNGQPARQSAYWFERGDVLDGLGRYDEAFDAYAKGNRLIQESPGGEQFRYRREHYRALASRLKGFFTRERVGDIHSRVTQEHLPDGMPRPIFVAGFPRSGTTLVEQILTAHPNVSPGDELPYVSRLTVLASHMTGSRAPYPDCLANLLQPEHRNALDKFRTFYIFNVQNRRVVQAGTKRFTDKMPLNETHLGLIHLMFPTSPVVHLIRHPLDVVLSSFFNQLTHGGNCAFELATAAEHYALIFDLVQHYRRELDARYLPLRYEDLVEDPETKVRQLLEFVGEPWDDRCLEFHRSSRFARTPSNAAVGEKIYTRSRYRYRNYRKHVEPIIPILEPAIRALGYEID